MIKHEIKVELTDSNALENLIRKAYFDDGYLGKIMNKNHYIKIEDTNEVDYTIFKGLNNVTTKIINEDVIDGVMRFIVDETQGEIRLYPISIYCIKEENKYIFY